MSEGKPSWRKIEAALVDILRSYGYSLDQHGDSGDKLVDLSSDTISVTELAKELEDRL